MAAPGTGAAGATGELGALSFPIHLIDPEDTVLIGDVFSFSS